jgi:hypothetical protein
VQQSKLEEKVSKILQEIEKKVKIQVFHFLDIVKNYIFADQTRYAHTTYNADVYLLYGNVSFIYY